MIFKKHIDPNWSHKREVGMDKALLEMSLDIHKRAVINAPILTGALKKSGRVSHVSEGYKISFGGPRVPYALRRHFENKKHPGSRLYLEKAGESVVRGNVGKYFKGKV